MVESGLISVTVIAQVKSAGSETENLHSRGWQRLAKLAEQISFGAAFGLLVHARRNEKDWTIGDLAEFVFSDRADPRAKSNETEISRLENGHIDRPQHKTVRRYTKALDIKADDVETLRASTKDPDAGKMAALSKHLTQIPQAQQARESGISETALINLVRPIAEDVEDMGTALIELTRAVEIAVRVQAEGRITSNHGDFVDEVLRRVAELARNGDYADAADEIEQALSREEAESQARKLRLLDSQVELAILARDPAATAARLVRKADTRAGGRADLPALRSLAIEWRDRGRDKGLNFDLEVAIALDHLNLPRTSTAEERGYVLNDLGTALGTLGEREPGTARLEQAVTAYTDALQELTRDRVPLDWAMTQNNLGNALRTLGEREPGTARLEQAVIAFTDALQERTRDRVPLDWAMTQNNLGNALSILGQREPGTARLEQAVNAYTDALQERTRDRVPLDWAATQNNLGNALKTLGEREPGTARLEQAVTAYTDALQERTRDRVPLNWAMTQNNLGTALSTLGQREPGTARLEPAVTAYNNALQERTRDRVPLDWAITHFNLTSVELAFFDKTGDAAHLDRAQVHLDNARAVFEQARAGQYLNMTAAIQAEIDTSRAAGP